MQSQEGDSFDPPESAALPASFFARPTAEVARDLLDAVLVSRVDGILAAGRIAETEAYLGQGDPGSHAATRGMTPRNSVMYRKPGTVYVYFTYGMHHMLNIVCEEAGVAGAVLIRALEPLSGIDAMRRRRGRDDLRELANGPGKLSQALGVDLRCNASELESGPLQVIEGKPSGGGIVATGRIGLRAGGELPLRFFREGDAFVSRGSGKRR